MQTPYRPTKGRKWGNSSCVPLVALKHMLPVFSLASTHNLILGEMDHKKNSK